MQSVFRAFSIPGGKDVRAIQISPSSSWRSVSSTSRIISIPYLKYKSYKSFAMPLMICDTLALNRYSEVVMLYLL